MVMTEAIRQKAIKDLTLHLAVLKDHLTDRAAKRAMNGISMYTVCTEVVKTVQQVEATKKAITYFKKLKIQTPKSTQQ